MHCIHVQLIRMLIAAHSPAARGQSGRRRRLGWLRRRPAAGEAPQVSRLHGRVAIEERGSEGRGERERGGRGATTSAAATAPAHVEASVSRCHSCPWRGGGLLRFAVLSRSHFPVESHPPIGLRFHNPNPSSFLFPTIQTRNKIYPTSYFPIPVPIFHQPNGT